MGPTASAWESCDRNTLWCLMEMGRRACFLLKALMETQEVHCGQKSLERTHTALFSAPRTASEVEKGLSDETSSLGGSILLPQTWLFHGNPLVTVG